MLKPVYLLTVQDTHKEHNSLTDQIRAKYEQLDSGKFGAVGTPAFNAQACKLANLLAWVSQLCQKTESANIQGTVQAHILPSIEDAF